MQHREDPVPLRASGKGVRCGGGKGTRHLDVIKVPQNFHLPEPQDFLRVTY